METRAAVADRESGATMTSNRHYRKCAYCGKREYGANIACTMELTSYGLHDRSESHFAHKKCPRILCPRCGGELTSADRVARACSQCNEQLAQGRK